MIIRKSGRINRDAALSALLNQEILIQIRIAATKQNRVNASIKARAKIRVVRISPAASGCLAVPSMAARAAMLWENAEAIAAKVTVSATLKYSIITYLPINFFNVP
jgi:hypothetical protein